MREIFDMLSFLQSSDLILRPSCRIEFDSKMIRVAERNRDYGVNRETPPQFKLDCEWNGSRLLSSLYWLQWNFKLRQYLRATNIQFFAVLLRPYTQPLYHVFRIYSIQLAHCPRTRCRLTAGYSCKTFTSRRQCVTSSRSDVVASIRLSSFQETKLRLLLDSDKLSVTTGPLSFQGVWQVAVVVTHVATTKRQSLDFYRLLVQYLTLIAFPVAFVHL